MIRLHSTTFAIVALVIVATAASAQDGLRASGTNLAQIDSAMEALDLSEQQIEQIREIWSARPPRGQNREELQAWREDQQAQVADLLTAEQRSELAEIEASREQLRALLGASMLSLAQVEREDRQDRAERSRAPRDDWFYGADRSRYPRFGQQRGWGRFDRGRSIGAGRGGRGGRRGNRF